MSHPRPPLEQGTLIQRRRAFLQVSRHVAARHLPGCEEPIPSSIIVSLAELPAGRQQVLRPGTLEFRDARRPHRCTLVQTAFRLLHPHIVDAGRAASRGDRFVPVPDVGAIAAQRLSRHEVFAFLMREELISTPSNSLAMEAVISERPAPRVTDGAGAGPGAGRAVVRAPELD